MATNYERAFEPRPAVYAAWQQLNGAIKAGMDLRRYELATLAAARRLRSSYCCLAHGRILAERFGEPAARIAADHRAAGLDDVDIAVMDLAEQVAGDATSVGEADLQRLRDLGLSHEEVMDVILAAAARCFSPRPSMRWVCGPTPAIVTWNPAFARPSSSAARSPTAKYAPAVIAWREDQSRRRPGEGFGVGPEVCAAGEGPALARRERSFLGAEGSDDRTPAAAPVMRECGRSAVGSHDGRPSACA